MGAKPLQLIDVCTSIDGGPEHRGYSMLLLSEEMKWLQYTWNKEEQILSKYPNDEKRTIDRSILIFSITRK